MALIKSLGRMTLASVFITGGYSAFSKPEGRALLVEKAGIPQAKQATILNSAVMMVAGSTLALDILPKLSALALAGTIVPTTLVGHSFWNEEDPAKFANQRTQFMKNLSILGGLLVYIVSK